MHSVASDDDPNKDQELADALQNVKDQIVFKANEIKSEKRWVKEVTKIIEAYIKKTRRVNSNIRDLQKAVKVLFRKKKQIENMIVQRKLEQKLKVAGQDLDTIRQALTSVKKKQDAFNKSKKDISQTIGAMQAELAKLRGEGAGSSSSSSGSSSSSSSN
jgi:chromosome segregation ATPase